VPTRTHPDAQLKIARLPLAKEGFFCYNHQSQIDKKQFGGFV
jgi:hypothetical protein